MSPARIAFGIPTARPAPTVLEMRGIRFVEDNGDGQGAGGDSDLGFPANTAWRDMQPAEQVAYWQHQSRKHENTVNARRDYDQLKADSEELARVRQESQTDQEKALDQARDEARREGENIGAERYLKDAVTGRFQALTGKTDDEVATIFAHVDAKSFTSDSGDIDVEKLRGFAATVGTTKQESQQQSHDPVREALERQRGGGGSQAGSIRELKNQRREALAPKK